MSHSIQHHLSEELLFGYSAGTLPEAFNLMVAAHISICDHCRAIVESYDALGGALVETAPDAPVAVGGDALSAVLNRISEPAKPAAPRRSKGVLPSPLQDYVGGDLESIRWRPVGMGVRQAILTAGASGSARLLYIPAGTAIPDHGHRGTELTMVLQGAFLDEDEYFARGDVETADEHVEHTPIADVGADCICLAVTDAPLRFRKLVPRLLQPLLRI
ncbi:MAG: ChrR family anti-sigma-E factor [Paracoccaceae bacterium]